MVWVWSRDPTQHLRVVEAGSRVPAVKGDGAPGTHEGSCQGRCRLCPSWAGPLHMKIELVCSWSFMPHIS